MSGLDTGWVEVARCPVCGASRPYRFEEVEDSGRQLRYRICRACGAVFQSPRMSEAALAHYYQADYSVLHQGVAGITQKELGVQAGRARHFIRLLERTIRSIDRHLDVGSSTGTLMHAVAGRYACRSVGVEPATLYRSYSVARKQTVYANLHELADAEAAPFDLISVAHVLEHLPRPVEYLQQLRQAWLKSGGHLLVEVPNLFGHQSLETPHLFAFHAQMLRRTLAEAGYRVVWLIRHGIPRSKLIPLYLTVLATPKYPGPSSPSPSWPASRVRLARAVGMAWHRFATRIVPGWAWLPFPDPLEGFAASSQAAEG